MRHLWLFAIRSLRVRKARSLFTAFGVACGVAMMLGLGIAYSTAELRIYAIASALAGPADIRVHPRHASLMPQDCVKAASAVPEVAAVSPLLRGGLRAVHGKKAISLVVLGIDAVADGRIRRYPVTEGGGLSALTTKAENSSSGSRPVLLLSYPSKKLEAGVEDEIVLGFGQRRLPFVVKGILADDAFPFRLDGPTAVMRLADLQEIMGLEGRISEINLSLAPDADENAAIARLSEQLGPTILVSGREAITEALTSNLSIARLFARMLSVVTLFVGVFIVYNAIGMTVVERARELGVLRALGATRRQVFSVILLEAIIIGLVGSALGLVLGGMVGRLALRLAAGHEVTCVVTRAALLVSGLVGVLGTVFAGIFPAVRAATLDPVDVLRPYAADPHRRWRRTTLSVGLLLIGLSLLTLYAPLPAPVKVYGFSYVGILAFMMGMAALAPGAIRAVARRAFPLVAVLRSGSASLAMANVARTAVRTGLAACALMVGIGFVIDISGNVGSLIRHWERAIQAMRGADMVATPRTPAQAALTADIFHIEGVAEVAGVKMMLTETMTPFSVMSRPFGLGRVLFTAIDPAPFARVANLDFEGCSAQEAFAALNRGGGVIVSSDFAQMSGARTGGSLCLLGRSGPVTFRIAGIVRDPRLSLLKDWNKEADYRGLIGSLMVFGSMSDARRHFGVDSLDLVLVKLAPGVNVESMEKRIQGLAWRNGWRATDLRQHTEAVFNDCRRKMGYINAILFVAILVGALSVINTMAMNVSERRREIGVVRALGATRRQVIGSVLVESGIIGLTGGILGGIMGFFLIHASSLIARVALGFQPPYLIPVRVIAGCMVVSVGLSWLAGLLPALRAGWSNIAEAVRAE